MSITVTPKKHIRENAQFYGDAFGMTAVVNLSPEQKWNARKYDGYWHVTKKGAGIELRLTDAAMGRLFEVVKI